MQAAACWVLRLTLSPQLQSLLQAHHKFLRFLQSLRSQVEVCCRSQQACAVFAALLRQLLVLQQLQQQRQ